MEIIKNIIEIILYFYIQIYLKLLNEHDNSEMEAPVAN